MTTSYLDGPQILDVWTWKTLWEYTSVRRTQVTIAAFVFGYLWFILQVVSNAIKRCIGGISDYMKFAMVYSPLFPQSPGPLSFPNCCSASVPMTVHGYVPVLGSQRKARRLIERPESRAVARLPRA